MPLVSSALSKSLLIYVPADTDYLSKKEAQSDL